MVHQIINRMKNIIYLSFIALFIICFSVNSMAQDSSETVYTESTFKSTRISLGQSVETAPDGDLIFDIQHHFGAVNQGAYEFFGLDQANTRLGLQYGLTDWLTIGFGRSSFQKLYDGSVKVKILRQSSGKRNMPVTISYFGNIGISSLKWQDTTRTNYFSSRLSFVNQLMIARKFGEAISLQLTPTLIHRNLVERKVDDNDVLALGAGGKFQLSERLSLNVEYYYILSKQTAEDFHNSLTVGLDIETGGHVFQLFFTNSRGIVEQQFIPATTGNWLNGDIHFGFNISRSFSFKQKDYWE